MEVIREIKIHGRFLLIQPSIRAMVRRTWPKRKKNERGQHEKLEYSFFSHAKRVVDRGAAWKKVYKRGTES